MSEEKINTRLSIIESSLVDINESVKKIQSLLIGDNKAKGFITRFCMLENEFHILKDLFEEKTEGIKSDMLNNKQELRSEIKKNKNELRVEIKKNKNDIDKSRERLFGFFISLTLLMIGAIMGYIFK